MKRGLLNAYLVITTSLSLTFGASLLIENYKSDTKIEENIVCDRKTYNKIFSSCRKNIVNKFYGLYTERRAEQDGTSLFATTVPSYYSSSMGTPWGKDSINRDIPSLTIGCDFIATDFACEEIDTVKGQNEIPKESN